VYSKKASKAIAQMDNKTKRLIKESVEGIPAGDIKPLEGYSDGTKRLKVGKYRIIFVISDGVVSVSEIGPRGDIYK